MSRELLKRARGRGSSCCTTLYRWLKGGAGYESALPVTSSRFASRFVFPCRANDIRSGAASKPSGGRHQPQQRDFGRRPAASGGPQ